jgi:hypothetical protein
MSDTDTSQRTQDGGCTCRYIRYRMSGEPLFVHCCHCRWCQRETGSAFVLNAMIEAERVQLLEGEVQVVATPTNSGKGQQVARCPKCFVALWSHYVGAGNAVSFVRVGTLDNPDTQAPDVHIFTSTKQPWLQLSADVPAFAEFYKPAEQWPKDSLDRYAALKAKK